MSLRKLICFIGCLLTAPAAAQDAEQEAKQFLGLCTGNEVPAWLMDTLCASTKARFVVDYQLALRGERTGQRNVAFCLSNGCSRAVAKNAIQACAWRIVVVKAGHSENFDGDASNLRSACRSLDEAGRMAAEGRANRILAQIRPLPPAALESLRDELEKTVPPEPSRQLPPCTPGDWGCPKRP